MAKAKNFDGNGYTRKRKDGRWEYREMCGYREDGSRRIISFYARTPKELQEKVEEHRANKRDGLLLQQEYTFSEWADVWYNHHKRTVTESTQENYKYTLRILKYFFGDYKLDEIKPFHVENFIYDMKKEGRSDSGVAQCRGMLYQILDLAVANDLLRKNSVAYAKKSRSTKPPKEKPVFTAEEVKRLMQELPMDRIGLSIRLLLATGIRKEELLGLKRDCIEEDGSEIRIRLAVKRVKGTAVVGDLKNTSSYRNIPIPHNLRPHIAALRNMSTDFIWESPKKKGQPCNPSHFERAFKAALKEIDGMSILTPHCCRHTYVSQMQALGVSMETIQSLCGHAEKSMTQHYLHVQRPVQEVAVESFSNTFVPQINAQT